MDLYLELGKKRVFACAVDWPGLSRSGRDEASAVDALIDNAPRYAKAIESSGLSLDLATDLMALDVIERLPGDSTTDFGAPGAIPAADRQPCNDACLTRLQALLDATWRAFAEVVSSADGVELRRGPRGGGRDLDKIVSHVLDAHAAYLSLLGCDRPKVEGKPIQEAIAVLHEASVTGMVARARGELPDRGPRGGERWPASYFARRSIWHILDHVWEIEDRLT